MVGRWIWMTLSAALSRPGDALEDRPPRLWTKVLTLRAPHSVSLCAGTYKSLVVLSYFLSLVFVCFVGFFAVSSCVVSSVPLAL